MHGFVRDQNGKPIDGAEIKIDDRTKIVHSTKDGAFWRLLLPGKRFSNEPNSGLPLFRYHFGTDFEISIKEIIKLLSRQMDSKVSHRILP